MNPCNYYPPCDIPSGCCSFTGPWTVIRSALRMLRPAIIHCPCAAVVSCLMTSMHRLSQCRTATMRLNLGMHRLLLVLLLAMFVKKKDN